MSEIKNVVFFEQSVLFSIKKELEILSVLKNIQK
jgi:hypothetical protein